MSVEPNAILLVYGVFLLTIISPGPNNLAVFAASMAAGRAAGTALALGVTTASFCWASLTAAGLSSLVAASPATLHYLRLCGGLYLLWLAYRSFRSATTRSPTTAGTNPRRGPGPAFYFWRGFLIQMTNPKAALTWIAVVSLGLSADSSAGSAVAIVAGTTLIAATVHCAYAVVFSTRSATGRYQKARPFLECFMGAVFTLAGVKLLLRYDH